MEGKHLTFALGNEGYGIPIHQVKEIIGMMEITSIPKTPPFIKGIINLRGKIVPIIDLRVKFGLPEREYTERTCIIVIEINPASGKRTIGVVVDTVSEVINIQAGDIETDLRNESVIDGKFMTGIAKLKNKVVVLLEVDYLMVPDELTPLQDGEGESNNV